MFKNEKILSKTIYILFFGLIVLPILILALFIMVGFLDRIVFENKLSSIPPEKEEIPAFYINGSLYLENEEYELYDTCRKLGYDLQEVLCLSSSNAFVVCENVSQWTLAMISLPNMEFDVIYEFKEPACDYRCAPSAPLMMRNGFYYNGRIILNDRRHVVSIDLISDKVEILEYSQFVFPEQTYHNKVLENGTIEIANETFTKQFEFQDMADGSSGIMQFYKLREKKTWSGNSRVGSFYNSIQTIGKETYAIGSCMNFSGESYAVVLYYNQETDLWEYINYYYSGDVLGTDCYLIAEVGSIGADSPS